MPAPFRTWQVLPHGPLQALNDKIMTVVGTIPMPLGRLPRRMTAVKLSDGRLVIFSAIALFEPEMARLEAFGEPGFLVVPNSIHRLDARIWKARYPSVRVVGPEGARDKIERVVPVDTTTGAFGDAQVRLVAVPGTRAQELALEVDGDDGVTLVVNDIVGNIRDARGLGGLVLRATRFAGKEPHVPWPVRLALIKNAEVFRRQLLTWAEVPGLRRILMAHGEPIEADPRRALQTLARELGT